MRSTVRRSGALLGVTLTLGPTACESEPPLGDSEAEAGDSTDASTGSSASGGDEAPTGEFVDLVDHAEWTTVEAVADPLAEHRPSLIECGIAGWYTEGESLEVDTNFCNYLALAQPSLAAIHAGRGVRLGFYYFDLTAREPASAHLAVLVDGELLYEQAVDIPGDAMVHSLEFEAPFDAPEGATVVFHLHNHGQNTWVLQSLAAEQ